MKLSKYAGSLGLAVPPRLRFIEKDRKIQELLAAAGETSIAKIKSSTTIADNDSSDDEDDLFDVQKRDVTELTTEQDSEITKDLEMKNNSKKVKSSKIVSKALRNQG